MQRQQVKELTRTIRRQVPSRWRLRRARQDPAWLAGRLRLATRLVELSLRVAREDLRRLQRAAVRRPEPALCREMHEAARALDQIRELRADMRRMVCALQQEPVFRFLVADRPARLGAGVRPTELLGR
jgi:hypothetical protein